ncbi:unnamed protein product [Ranitomeya imitator]|uniref:UDENN FNIP1/2-type domain-containing protein n=1 Tax=Ranitomeya imitator TaxID=111125 RepID=A0ABN9KUD9_9NEOB|nr:unnamed protein product [Ranitomeya imitator]
MQSSWPSYELDPSQIRLVVYQDCEKRGRNVLFDSNAKRKTEDLSVSKLVSDTPVRVFGKCCQLRPGGDSSTSLDSSASSLASDTKEQCPKYQDNDPKQTSRLCKGSLTKKQSDGVLRQMTWPPQSPDLNPIEMVWGHRLGSGCVEKLQLLPTLCTIFTTCVGMSGRRIATAPYRHQQSEHAVALTPSSMIDRCNRINYFLICLAESSLFRRCQYAWRNDVWVSGYELQRLHSENSPNTLTLFLLVLYSSPPQLMLSKVFTARTGSSIYGSLNTLQDSFENISHENTLKAENTGIMNGLLGNIVHSNPMDMPGRGFNDDRDSGIARSASLSSLLITPFPSPSSSLNSSCASSYQRRWRRSQTTSLENGVFPRWSVEESFNMSDDSCGPNLGVTRKKKIAIGVIFSLSKDEDETSKFHEFFFSHFPLFESHMNKLKCAIEQAMKMSRRLADASQRSLAYNKIVEALNEFRTTICNLYTMPRISEPVWLTMMSGSPEKNHLCQRFMKEFAFLMEYTSKNHGARGGFCSQGCFARKTFMTSRSCDCDVIPGPSRNASLGMEAAVCTAEKQEDSGAIGRFLPALLTAVLTNHLAWVPTVMPNGQPPIKIFLEKHSSKSVDMLAKTHPYNPLWAQLEYWTYRPMATLQHRNVLGNVLVLHRVGVRRFVWRYWVSCALITNGCRRQEARSGAEVAVLFDLLHQVF